MRIKIKRQQTKICIYNMYAIEGLMIKINNSNKQKKPDKYSKGKMGYHWRKWARGEKFFWLQETKIHWGLHKLKGNK